ncbi:right-handed parallel beta-helix repeat-containing protein [Acidipila sp. EB88]|uniref:right-handed parallel beta-helix repeat-containing protein n=1 Tax=Acidipila sp. EB88 TaxID=2305226 RepID=UPI000F5D7127|nr:right-handed parallel beta-helix repeat-containing protein [Acidipila sp. EB88]
MRSAFTLIQALGLLAATPALATTYYVSPSGNDSAPGTTQSTPWKTVAHVNAHSFQSGDTIAFLAGGTWREQLLPKVNNLTFTSYGSGARPIISGANVYTTGWAAGGSTNVWKVLVGSYAPEQVWFNTVLGRQVATQSAVLAPTQWYFDGTYLFVYSTGNPGTAYKAPGIEAAQRDSAVMIASVSGTTLSGLAFVNPNYTAIDIESSASGTQTITNVLFQGAQYEGLRAEGGTQVVSSSKGLYNETGIGIGGGSGMVVSNSILSGNYDGAFEVYGTTAASTITGSTITGNSTGNAQEAVIRNYSSYPLTVSHSILLPNPEASLVSTYIDVTDDGTNVNTSPAFTQRAAPLIIVPFIDDYINLGVAQSVATLAQQYGCKLSYALNTKLVTPTDWQTIIGMQKAGTEIVAHTRSHGDLANPMVVTIQYTGTASTATMNVNQPVGRLQTFLNGSTTPDLDVDISNTYNGMIDVCSVVQQNTHYSCVPLLNQNYFTPAELAAVTGVNILQPYVAAATSDYLTYEVEGSLADIEANMPGYTPTSFATPFSSSSETVENHVRDAGFAANRNSILDANENPNGSWLLSNLDIYDLASIWIPSGFDATKPTSSAAAIVEGMGAVGGVMGIYSHGVDEFSLASWQTLFQNLQSFGATCMTMSQATQYIESHGTLVPDGTKKNWIEAVPFNPNYANTAQSPTQGAHGVL